MHKGELIGEDMLPFGLWEKSLLGASFLNVNVGSIFYNFLQREVVDISIDITKLVA